MIRLMVLVFLCLVPVEGFAQAPSVLPENDLDLVNEAAVAIGTVSMPLTAHQQVHNVLEQLGQRVVQRGKDRAEKKTGTEAPEKEVPKK